MNNLKIFCISLSNAHLKAINGIGHIPVGIGEGNFSDGWTRDNTGKNIAKKNKYYGELTFHYWFWNHGLKEIEDKDWIGFCHYRRFWSNEIEKTKFQSLNQSIIKKIPEEWKNHDSVLVQPIPINITKFSKIIKHGKKQLFKNPFVFFNKKKITIKIHFDMYHGHGNLEKAINLLDIKDREKFRKFTEEETSFNPYHMVICNSKKVLYNYYSSLFEWLKKCEDIFGFDMETNYGSIRIYAFLAERYLSYWFRRYTNPISWPIHYYDISNDS